MRASVRSIDVALAVWTAAWLVAGAVVFTSLGRLEDGGAAVVSAGEGLEETSRGLRRAGNGLHETADALAVLGDLPFVPGNPGEGIEDTADDVDRLAAGVRAAGRDAQATGADASDAAGTLAIVLGLAVALGPTLPAFFLYLILRPVVARQLSAA